MNNENTKPDLFLFWGCFIALIATAFGFIVRAMIIGEWGKEFGLTQTQQGELFGAGLYPFAISIILFSLIIDKVGYKNSMIFGFLCHVIGTTIIIFANGYNMLYLGTFILALGNGTVEAYINPVVATMFTKQKTKWLTILHAGWPGGLVLAGVLAIGLGALAGADGEAAISWRGKFALVYVPTAIYFLMLIAKKFPVNERVAAGVPYRDMIKEVGGIGMFIMFALIFMELTRVFELFGDQGRTVALAAAGVIGLGTLIYTGGLGRPVFIILLIIMIPLATTELGVDSWVTELMTPVMGEYAGWLLVYTSFIMMVLRFMAGPILHSLKPLGILAVCAALAAVGLFLLSGAKAGAWIFLAATVYGVGKTFFWPATLGVVAEQFPRGGAMTLNGVAAVGMLGVGVLGTQFMGNIQDKTIDRMLTETAPEVREMVIDEERLSLFGRYQPVSGEKVAALPEEKQALVTEIQDNSKQEALKTIVIFPIFMLACYILLILFYKARGGYKPVDIGGIDEAQKADPGF